MTTDQFSGTFSVKIGLLICENPWHAFFTRRLTQATRRQALNVLGH